MSFVNTGGSGEEAKQSIDRMWASRIEGLDWKSGKKVILIEIDGKSELVGKYAPFYGKQSIV